MTKMLQSRVVVKQLKVYEKVFIAISNFSITMKAFPKGEFSYG
jgi:hypothetical protein